ncbi:MAG: hypothetical protein AMDU4_FER2C00232G0003 [Ferroplasma sp. Type II]|nr:MAG: hypothetical protein AMDU4_FER2C00232G0003 [Ferroplasma sp. Type II]
MNLILLIPARKIGNKAMVLNTASLWNPPIMRMANSERITARHCDVLAQIMVVRSSLPGFGQFIENHKSSRN